MFKNNLCFVVVFAVLLSNVIASRNVVPVFFWETYNDIPLVPALEKLTEKSFENILSKHLLDDARVLVFVEDSLNPEDFAALRSSDRASKSKLASIRDDNAVSYFPFVQSPVSAVRRIFPDALKISLSDLLDDESALLDNRVVIVNLDDSKENEDGLERFKRHAFKVFELYEKVAENYKHVTGLLTGYKGSWIAPETKFLSRKVRDVTVGSSADDRRAFYFTNDTLLYVNSTITFFYNNVEKTLNGGNTTFNTAAADSNIVATLSGNETEIIFNFTTTNGYWYLSDLSVIYGGNDISLRVESVYAASNFSYTCNRTIFYNASNSDVNLTLPGFQVQPFFGVTHDGNFSDPYNCVGFTTIPIWSGLFVTFILAIIMTFGLTFMMDIRTMDRFDDPKGKTIVINVSE